MNATNETKNLNLNLKFDTQKNQNILLAALHLSTLVFFILGPLAVWLINRKNDSIYKKEAIKMLNYCITILGLNIISLLEKHVPLGTTMSVGISFICIGIIIKAAYDGYHMKETEFYISYPFIKG